MTKAPQGIENVYADGAYDASECRQGAKICGATALITPSRNAVIHTTEDPESFQVKKFEGLRNKAIFSYLMNDSEDLIIL